MQIWFFEIAYSTVELASLFGIHGPRSVNHSSLSCPNELLIFPLPLTFPSVSQMSENESAIQGEQTPDSNP